MTYYGGRQLAESFRTVRKNTLTIAEEIPEEKYSFKATPEVMSVGEILAHLAINPLWQIDVHSKHVPLIDAAFFTRRMQEAAAQQAALRTKAEIVAALREHGERFGAFLDSLDEATLAEIVSFPPPIQPSTKSRFELLLGAKEHEMHHRGQLMLIQRLIGQVPHLTRARQARQAQAAVARA
jgi:uncharacterized damage-inducible protein DinB